MATIKKRNISALLKSNVKLLGEIEKLENELNNIDKILEKTDDNWLIGQSKKVVSLRNNKVSILHSINGNGSSENLKIFLNLVV